MKGSKNELAVSVCPDCGQHSVIDPKWLGLEGMTLDLECDNCCDQVQKHHRIVSFTRTLPGQDTDCPGLDVSLTPGPNPSFQVAGWDDVDRWGSFNCAAWRRIRSFTSGANGIYERDELRLLAGEMLRVNAALMKEILEVASRPPTRIIVIDPQHDKR